MPSNNKAIPRGMAFIPKVDKAMLQLSGGVGGVDLKPIVLGLIFFKDASKTTKEDPWAEIIKNIDSPHLIDRIIEGFRTISRLIHEASRMFEEINLNNEKLGNKEDRTERIRSVIKLIDEIEQEDEYCLGNVYQYLISLFANSPGRYGGEYYTPSSMCKLISLLTLENNSRPRKIYDPTCGSGSLLMSLYKASGSEPEVYGQELNKTTCNICFGNMYLNGVKKYSIKLGDTLKNPKHLNHKFDAIVCNPPFSSRWKGSNDIRFKGWPEVPKSKADFAFLLHCVHNLDEGGTITIVIAPGVLHRSLERRLRQELIDRNLVACVIQLAENLFLNTTTAVSVLILKKNKTNDKVLFIDARKIFTKQRGFNILNKENIEEILSIYRLDQNIPGKSYIATNKEIKENEYLLTIPRYIEPSENEFTPINSNYAKRIHRRSIDYSKKEISRLLLSEILDMKFDSKNYGGKYVLIEHTNKLLGKLLNWTSGEYKFCSFNDFMNRWIKEMNEKEK